MLRWYFLLFLSFCSLILSLITVSALTASLASAWMISLICSSNSSSSSVPSAFFSSHFLITLGLALSYGAAFFGLPGRLVVSTVSTSTYLYSSSSSSSSVSKSCSANVRRLSWGWFLLGCVTRLFSAIHLDAP